MSDADHEFESWFSRNFGDLGAQEVTEAVRRVAKVSWNAGAQSVIARIEASADHPDVRRTASGFQDVSQFADAPDHSISSRSSVRKTKGTYSQFDDVPASFGQRY